MLAEIRGDVDAALAGYDEIAHGRDRLARARAMGRAVELRLAHKRIDAAAAARALEGTLFAWRWDADEAATRIRPAALRQEAGDARGALALLRETEALFPERAQAVRPALGTAFLAALTQAPPLNAIALFDAYPELLPQGEQGEAAILALADRLVDLDLGDRAAALLGQAAARIAGPVRASFGLRQGVLRMSEGNGVAALKALQESEADAMPEALARDRAVLAARARARLGQVEDALAGLGALGPFGLEEMSQLLAQRQDWAGAAAALAAYLRATVAPAPAPLDGAQRRMLVRQAAMLALAGDESGLASLRFEFAPRLPEGPLAAAFTLLTADHLSGLTDLPRLQRELSLFRAISSRLEALRAGGPMTR
jgi:hypothetical protein